MTTAKVGERYQVVIPRKEREKLNIKPGSHVEVQAVNGVVIIRPLGKSGMRGIGKVLSDGQDATDYVRELRAEWGREK